ncbi:MAG: c-type cytochrome biogenesis protein CcmI [Bauldia sp.]|nr:c-type cytochrome biogenesis protein CcmI [Bauldia sp.]MCW5716959.1 c-type cytochrome biogenesis protein CcmI [Bauldia sp.]
MALWIAMAVLTAAAAIALLAPLLRNRAGTTARDAEKAIYRDQLDEVARDVSRGVLAPGEAEAARVEISRRLLKADESAPDTAITTSNRSRIAAVIAVVVLPTVGLALYPWWLGSPGLRDMPIEERLADPRTDDLPAMAVALDAALQANPDNAGLWQEALSVYAQIGRFDGVAAAYANIVRLRPDTDPTGDIGVGLGELIVNATGTISVDALRIFDTVLTINPAQTAPRVYRALALQQAGLNAEAIVAWQEVIAAAPPEGAPWVTLAEQQLAQLGAGPAAGDTATAAAVDAQIRAMVDNLAANLVANPQDAEGWMRLIRSYVVLGELDLARQAVTSARSTFAGNDQAIQMIEGGVLSTPGAALTANPGDVNAWAQLIRSYNVLGLTVQATEAVGQARAALAGNAEGLALIDAVAQELEQP